jgi:hypothetical protein
MIQEKHPLSVSRSGQDYNQIINFEVNNLPRVHTCNKNSCQYQQKTSKS